MSLETWKPGTPRLATPEIDRCLRRERNEITHKKPWSWKDPRKAHGLMTLQPDAARHRGVKLFIIATRSGNLGNGFWKPFATP